MIEFLIQLDKSFFLFLHNLNTSYLNVLMNWLSSQVIWIPIFIFFIFQAWKNEPKNKLPFFLIFLAMTLALSDVTSSYILKNLFHRLRPCRDPEFLQYIIKFNQRCGGKYGFVSSHASNSFALIYYFLRTLNFKNSWIGLFIFPLLVGFSRIYLGVHYPGDILGGFLVGAIWSSLFSWSYLKIREQDETSSSHLP